MPRPDLFFLAGQSLPRCDHRIDKYFTAYQTLQFMAGGEVTLSVGKQTYALSGRHAWSGFAGPRISFRPTNAGQTWSHRYVAFRGPLVRRWIDDGLFPVRPQQVAAADFDDRFDAVLSLIADTSRASAVKAAYQLEGLLLDLSQTPTAAPASNWVDVVQQELKRPDAAVDYDTLATRLGLSVRGLRRHFRAQTGQSPHQYVIGLRVASAREMLLKTDLPVKEIARRLGYADVFYFGRQFKRQTGVSPALFRRSREG